MFEDCKTGGYNLATIYTTNQHLIALILLIAIAYSCAVLSGRHSRHMGVQKYVGRLNELKRTCRRHSAFLDWFIWSALGRRFLKNGQI